MPRLTTGRTRKLPHQQLKHDGQQVFEALPQIMVGIVDVLLDRVDGDVKLFGNFPLVLSGEAGRIHAAADIRKLVKGSVDHRVDFRLNHFDRNLLLDGLRERQPVGKVLLHAYVFQMIQNGMIEHPVQIAAKGRQIGESLLPFPYLQPGVLNEVRYDVFIGNILHPEIFQAPKVGFILLPENVQVGQIEHIFLLPVFLQLLHVTMMSFRLSVGKGTIFM